MEEKFSRVILLILFTTLLPVAIGVEVGAALACWVAGITADAVAPVLWWALGLFVLSSIFVTFHLGHAERAFASIRGAKHSLLSREIILAGCFGFLLAAAVLCVYKTEQRILFNIVLGLGGVLGLATAGAIGRVYDLPAQISWRGPVPATGPVMGSVLIAVPVLYILNEVRSINCCFL